ncbi:MAG: class I SAM-dependent methyltransferase [Desulfobacterales bacterium]
MVGRSVIPWNRLRCWHTRKANEQHYAVPAGFFEAVLDKHLKYSAGLWPEQVQGLDEAEAAMLDLTCERAEIADGMRILELGCGWGGTAMRVTTDPVRMACVDAKGDLRLMFVGGGKKLFRIDDCSQSHLDLNKSGEPVEKYDAKLSEQSC